MTDEQINIAVAGACGWRRRAEDWIKSVGDKNYLAFSADGLPDYCHDLNAIHEAEKTLKQEQRFLDALAFVVSGETAQWWYKRADLVCQMVHTTAYQRAEAFLRCLGKWKENA